MDFTLSVFSEQSYQEQRKNARRPVRESVVLRIILADKGGLASGQVLDMTMRGCGLCLTEVYTGDDLLTERQRLKGDVKI